MGNKGSIDRIGHETGVDRTAARKRHYRQHSCRRAGGREDHPEQPIHKPDREPELAGAPSELTHRGPHGIAFALRRSHTITPGRHGSMVTSRDCSSTDGAPIETPAIVSPLGNGFILKVQR